MHFCGTLSDSITHNSVVYGTNASSRYLTLDRRASMWGKALFPSPIDLEISLVTTDYFCDRRALQKKIS